MTKNGKNIKGPLLYFLLVLILLIGLVGWTSYQFGQQSIKNTKNDVQLVGNSGRIDKNAKAISDLTKQVEVLSTMTPRDGKDGNDGKDGTNAVSHDTFVEKQTVQEVPINGKNGDSAYQTWLSLGNSGTSQDFINALKGEDARGIEGCINNGTIGWRYVGDVLCKINTNSLKAK